MYNILLYNDVYTNGYRSNILDVIYILAILCSILALISKNPVISVLYLIGLFASISIFLIILGLNFIGLSYLIVYVGAVSILFLFILMLINIRISELQSDTNNSIALAFKIVIAFNFMVFQVLPYNIAILNNNTFSINYFLYNNYYKDELYNHLLNYTNNKIYFVSSKL
jgi:NADH-ubiquinone oxidoreductase chain 6